MISWKVRVRRVEAIKGNRGSVILETVISLLLILLMVGMNCEVIRHAYDKVLLHHAAFLYTRRLLLTGRDAEARSEAIQFLAKSGALGSQRVLVRKIDFLQTTRGAGLFAGLHVRYPSFFSFPYRGKAKRHFEVTQRCNFPFLSR